MAFLEILDTQLNDRLLRIAYQTESNVWKGNQLYPHLTHHDKKESEDVCQIIQGISGTLPPNQVLTDIEKFILSAATLLCNIGMQYPDLESSGKNFASLQESDLLNIFKNHPELSCRMIKKDSRIRYGQVEFPDLGLGPDDFYFEPIALLVKGHEGILLPEYQEQVWPGVGNIRLDLLAALLQLACCLSLNDQRLVMHRLKKSSGAEQIRLWKYVHYKGVLIKENGKIVQPLFNIPDRYKFLVPQLCMEIENSIRFSYNQVLHILRKYELKLSLTEATVIMQPNVIYPMPDAVREYMTSIPFRYIEIIDDHQQVSVDSTKTPENVSSIPPRVNDFLDHGRYEIVQVISTPGTSNSFVYLALDHKLSLRKVIIKIPAFFYDDHIPNDELTELKNRYRREIGILLQRPHPYVVKVYDLINERFMVQEYVEGKSLRGVIKQKEVLPISQVIQLALETCDSMTFLNHAVGIVHRDIKPEHLFIRNDGHLCLIDFGLARAELQSGVFDDWKTEKPVGGTPLYMAPEQALGKEDERSDIFSLGVTLYEVLTHQFSYPRGAFSAEIYTQKQIPGPQSIRSLRSDISDDLEACILKSLEVEPRMRFQNWDELSNALKNCLQKSTEESLAISPVSVKEQYEQMIVALLNDNGEQMGTGFLFKNFGSSWVISCAHIIQAMNKRASDIIKLMPFNSKIPSFQARVAWISFPPDQKPENWGAEEDICVLRVEEEFFWNSPPLRLSRHLDNFPVEDCWCFGYISSRKPRGAYIKRIRLNGKVAHGFIELSQLREDKLEAGIEPGASGAPLCGQQGEILGIIQSTRNEKVSYLIPADVIEEILKKLNERMRL